VTTLRLTRSPVGTAVRRIYAADYIVPTDWEDIRNDRATSDNLAPGFLWGRVGMLPPERK
jgi:hypothetical protein